MKKNLFILLMACLFLSSSVFAETIFLKSGKVIEGNILEKTDDYIKVDFEGIPVTYYLDEVERIEETSPVKSNTEGIESPDTQTIVIKIDRSNRRVPEDESEDKDASTLTISKKIRLAEKYLKEFKREANAFFAKVKRTKHSAQELKTKVNEFNAITSKYARRHNSLQFPCPRSSNTKNNPKFSGYIRWQPDFAEKQARIMDKYSQKINQLIKRSGY